ncbi:MAG: putative hydroxymethylpyrimidine transporter CytX [Chloroflexi bacterium]|nr:putative hydroxymethylpyrimidine transporter CytX [Chloroflexota bacterium]
MDEIWRRLLPQVKAPPEWGVEPVEKSHRILGFLDYLVLWGDLGVGLLVLLTGSFLVPGLGVGQALLAIVIGTTIGTALLALTGRVGSDSAVPTMVLLRPVLGIRGSYIPSVFNVIQLIGWTIFEIVIMGYAANAISNALFGFSSYPLWAGVFAAIIILMGVGGPVGVVRQWLKKFAVWIVLATTAWLSYHLLTSIDLAQVWNRPGDGSLPFWVGVDLVIAMPVSWLPLVADYSRFARNSSRAFWGTFIGFWITNVWFYSLGMLVLVAAGISQEPKGFVTALALTAGWLALLILLVDETDNAWADLYSAAISIQNIFPKVGQRGLIIALGLLSFVSALVLDFTQYESFLFLLGSFFVPLFGIMAADYFVLRRHKGRGYDQGELYRPGGAYWYGNGYNLLGIIAWVSGIIVYHITNPGTLGAFLPGWPALVPAGLTVWGGSIPAFVVAFIIYGVIGSLVRIGKE